MAKHLRTPPKTRLLGKPSAVPASPAVALLDRVPNAHPDTNYVARFAFPEFTCICPVTGQPDFAILMIDYALGTLTWTTVFEGFACGCALFAGLDVELQIKNQQTIRSLLHLNEALLQENEALQAKRIEIENSLFC